MGSQNNVPNKKDDNKDEIKNDQVNNAKNPEYNKIKNKGANSINIIYLDENIKYENNGIIEDCGYIQKITKCSLILINDINNLALLFEYLLKNNTKCKFIFIVNGGISEKCVSFIKSRNDYQSLFIGACIYTMNLEKYSNVKQNNSDFIYDICANLKNLIEFILKTAENSKIENQKYYINSIINLYTYKAEYFKLHKEISYFYGDKSKMSLFHYEQNKTNLPKDLKESQNEQILSCFQTFPENVNKNDEEIIVYYLKHNYFSEYLNSILKTKNFDNYKIISVYVGNLMYNLVEYAEKRNKAVDYAMTFFKGVQLNIVELMEFLKNKNNIITFQYFLSISSKKELAEMISKRKMEVQERKEKQFYSVILKIDYLYDDGYKPSVIDIRDLQPYPNDENYIILPFTFLYLKKITIDSNSYLADIELDIIGKNESLESQIKNDDKKVLDFDKENHIMFLK
jgi:hypothetical protein